MRVRNNFTERHQKALEQKWQPLVLEVMSGNSSADLLMDTIQRRDEFFFIEFIVRFANVLRGKEKELVTELSYPFLKSLLEDLKSAEPEKRAHIVKILSLLNFDTYSDNIIAALDDPSPLVSMVAAHALSNRAHAPFMKQILARLHRFESWSVHYMASMLSSAGPEMAPDLRAVYSDPEAPLRERTIAAEVLLLIKDFAAGDVASKILSAEEDRDLLAASLRLLKAFGHADHLPHIRRLCKSEDAVLKAQALSALGSIGTAKDTEILYKSLFDDSSWVVLHAARGLAQAGAIDQLKVVAASKTPLAEIAREVLQEVRH